MALFDTIRAGASGAGGDYEIERSLRFNDNDSASLSRTFGSGGNRRTFTFSAWLKISGKTSTHSAFFSAASGSNFFKFMFRDGGDARLEINTVENGSDSTQIKTKAKFRDTTAWFHVIIAFDTTQGTSSNRVKIYINGVQQTDLDSSSFPSQNHQVSVNSNIQHQLGNQVNTSNFFDGYMAEVNFIDGQQLTPDSFAETDAITGEYKAVKYTGSYGTTGFYLNFSDNSGTSSTTLGKDSSGNGNNFTPNNFSVSSGVGNDSVTDTPTNNWCTMNPLSGINNSPTFKNGNLEVNGPGSGIGKIGATCGLTSGKWYAEVKIHHNESQNLNLGVICTKTNYANNEYSGSGSDYAIAVWTTAKLIRKEGSIVQSSLGGLQNGDIIAFAIDLDNGTFQLYNNGNTKGNQVSFTIANYIPLTFTQTTGGNSSTAEWNFGQQGFTYTPPTGFKAVNSQNLPEPDAPKGSKYFDALLYTGNGSNSHAITGLDFSPDWVWIKARNATGSHPIFDTVRGATKRLGNSAAGVGTTPEDTVTASLKSFDSNGFTYGNEAGNNNGETYVAWCWDAGTSTVTNTAGSISSQVRANTTAGFSIVTYTGTGSNATVGHGLGVAPKMYIIKRRDSGSGNTNWRVFHHNLDNSEDPEEFHLQLNSSDAEAGQSNIFNDTMPTSTVFSIGTHASTGQSGGNFVAYVFAKVEGFSDFGLYSGNGNSNGQFIFTGFRPRYLMVKRADSGNHWVIYDSARSTINVVDEFLRADTNNPESEDSQVSIDFVSNGFKFRSGFDIVNAGSGRYIYMAFAENAFKFARAR